MTGDVFMRYLDYSSNTSSCKISRVQMGICENEKNEVLRYKARLLAQGFSQRSDIEYGIYILLWWMQLLFVSC